MIDGASGRILRLRAELGRLAEVRRFVREVAPRVGADDRTVVELVQAVDEWVTNVVVHGYRGAGGPVEVEISRKGDGICARVRDAAPPFDPATAPAFDPSIPLERRPFGGMGIHLIRDLADRFEHRALPEGGNEVSIQIARTHEEGT